MSLRCKLKRSRNQSVRFPAERVATLRNRVRRRGCARLPQYAAFEGRASPGEYWWWVLFIILSYLGLGALLTVMVRSAGVDPIFPGGVAVAWWLATLLPTLAVTVRRLHDTGRSGWTYLLNFVPEVGGLILLVLLTGGPAPDCTAPGRGGRSGSRGRPSTASTAAVAGVTGLRTVWPTRTTPVATLPPANGNSTAGTQPSSLTLSDRVHKTAAARSRPRAQLDSARPASVARGSKATRMAVIFPSST